MIKSLDNEFKDLFFKSFFDKVSFSDPFEFCLGYFLEDKLVGAIDYSVIYDRVEINYIAVLTDYRRRGIAQALFDECVRKTNFMPISLEVNVNNKEAFNFYLKNGFVKCAIRRKYYGNDDAYLMILEMK